MEEFGFDRDVLLGAIRTIGDVVATRNTIPILNNLLIETTGEGSALLRGTDLDKQVSIDVPAAGRGSITVPKDKLAAAVESLRPGPFAMNCGDGRAIIQQGRATRTLPTLPVADMPKLADPEGAIRFEVERTEILWLLDMTSTAMSNEPARAYLNGVYLHVHENSLRSVGMDFARLVCADMELPEAAVMMPGVIIPSGAVGLLRRLLSGSKVSRIGMTVSPARVSISIGDIAMVAKTVEGEYPDYRRIIPRPSARKLEVQAGELARGVKAAAAISDGKSRIIRMKLDGEECELSSSGSAASSLEPIDARYIGDELSLGVNATFVVSIAQLFGEAEPIELCFNESDAHAATAPLLVHSPQRPALLALVTPMRA